MSFKRSGPMKLFCLLSVAGLVLGAPERTDKVVVYEDRVQIPAAKDVEFSIVPLSDSAYNLNEEISGGQLTVFNSGPVDDTNAAHFRHEFRRQDGVVVGEYGTYSDDTGRQSVRYVADAQGYRVLHPGQSYRPISTAELERMRTSLITEDLDDDPVIIPDEDIPVLTKEQLARLNPSLSVNIQEDLSGSSAIVNQPLFHQQDPDTDGYQFSYQTAAEGNEHFRQEYRTPGGVVVGSYGHRDANGELHQVNYLADALGYRILQPGETADALSTEDLQRKLPLLDEILAEDSQEAETPEAQASMTVEARSGHAEHREIAEDEALAQSVEAQADHHEEEVQRDHHEEQADHHEEEGQQGHQEETPEKETENGGAVVDIVQSAAPAAPPFPLFIPFQYHYVHPVQYPFHTYNTHYPFPYFYPFRAAAKHDAQIRTVTSK